MKTGAMIEQLLFFFPFRDFTERFQRAEMLGVENCEQKRLFTQAEYRGQEAADFFSSTFWEDPSAFFTHSSQGEK